MGITDLIQAGASFVWGRIASEAARQRDARGLLAAYRFELESNLELLDAVNADALKGMDIADPDFRGLVENLHTEVAVTILYSADRERYARFAALLATGAADLRLITETEGVEETRVAESAIAAMSFTVRKIEALKSLIRFARPDGPLFPHYRLAVRIRHIKSNLITIRQLIARIAAEE